MDTTIGSVQLGFSLSSGTGVQLDAGRIIVRGPSDRPTDHVRSAAPGETVRIEGLPLGTYTVALEGLINGEVELFVQYTGVSVRAGALTSVTVTSFPSFVPRLNPIPPTGTSKTFTVSYEAIPDASSYRVEAATDAEFTVNYVSATTTQSSVDLTVPDYGTYFIRVRAISPYNQTLGRPSAAQSIELAQARPDLVISAPATLVATPSSVVAGQNVALSAWTVMNQGNAPAGDFSNGFYLSADATITPSDMYLGGNANTGPMAAGAFFSWSGPTPAIPANTPTGSYYIGILVDRVGDVTESNEANNFKSTALTVLRGPDLVISAPANLTVTPTSAVQGGHVTLSGFTVKNQGDAPTADFVIALLLSTDATITTSDTRLGAISIGALAVDGMISVPASDLTVPEATPPGSYFVAALLDEANETPESNETNNSKSTALSVAVVFASISAGGDHTCAVTNFGAAYCWGANGRGQLGDGTTNVQSTVPRLVSGNHEFASIASGLAHTCAVEVNESAWCWGDNEFGQLGNGTNLDRIVPAAVNGNLTLVAVTADFGHTCGLTSANIVYCWGVNHNGELGDGTQTSSNEPKLVQTSRHFTSASAGSAHSCGVADDRTAHCWGRNSDGELGRGFNSGTGLVPGQVTGSLSFSTVSAGGNFTCALTSSAAAYCWGNNLFGKLGDGTTQSRNAPALVSGGHTFLVVSAGSQHTCGVDVSTRAGLCWGNNDYGQLGDGTTTSRPTPVQVTQTSFVAISAGWTHTCGLTSNGAAYCWGSNTNGQLGNGGTTNSAIPVKVIGSP